MLWHYNCLLRTSEALERGCFLNGSRPPTLVSLSIIFGQEIVNDKDKNDKDKNV
jgi:hypothetical protein